MEDKKYDAIQGVHGAKTEQKDEGSYLWGLLGFFSPLIGFILFIIWSNKKPKSAKGAGIGALIPIVSVSLIFVIACFLPDEYDVYSEDGVITVQGKKWIPELLP